jgi:hypothetical protein
MRAAFDLRLARGDDQAQQADHRIQPEENDQLLVMAKTPGLDREGIRLREVPLDIGLANAFSEYRRRIAYERLLLDLIEGDPTLFVRRDEVEAQWAWIDASAPPGRSGADPASPIRGQLGSLGGDRADRARRRQLARVRWNRACARPAIAAVTDRIIERSKPTRRRYLELMAEQKERGISRPRLSCGNFAHGFAAAGEDKEAISRFAGPTSASSPPTTTCSRRISPTAATPSR